MRSGAASAGALKLLAAFPRTGGPLLVLSVKGRHIRAQETTLWMTRTALRRVPAMPAKLRPRRLLLEPVASDPVDLAGPPPAKPGQLKTLVDIYRSAGYRYGIDWRVLAFSAAVAIAAGLTFGLVPALRGSRLAPLDRLREGGRGAAGTRSHWLQHSFIVIETALAVALLTSAGLLLQNGRINTGPTEYRVWARGEGGDSAGSRSHMVP